MKPVRTINFVARQTGLSVQVIRVWEKRYGAVQPVRADNNRRLYTEEDVERLRLLRDATQAGHAIGQIATASLEELQRLVRETPSLPRAGGKTRGEETEEAARGLIEHAIVCVSDLDAGAFRKLLDRAAVELGSPAVLQRFIAPLAERVGDLWRAGDFTIAQEHFASTHVTDFLATFARPYAENVASPHLVLATPPGQLHELGAIIVAAAARSHGWRTTYLGAALPVEEMVGALRNLQPRALGLSIVYPPDDEALRRDLEKLRHLLPKECALLIGGRSSSGYTDLLRKIKAIEVRQLEDLYPVLDKLQRPQNATSAKPKRK
jgi:DNA-binding transcriptional MerR regulator/methylmalonyl-CoA mutase cobalamin-binding subunit